MLTTTTGLAFPAAVGVAFLPAVPLPPPPLVEQVAPLDLDRGLPPASIEHATYALPPRERY